MNLQRHQETNIYCIKKILMNKCLCCL